MAITKVSNSVLKDLAVDTQNIVDDSVTNAKIADNSIDSEHYVDGSIDAEHLSDDSISYNKLANEFTTSAVISASDIDFATAQVFTKTLAADTTFTFSNTSIGMVKDLVITGDFVITWPAGTKIAAGTYSGAVSNLIQVVVTAAGEYWLTISQEQV
jgi:hypothetical protein